jgi:hypothetical protein
MNRVLGCNAVTSTGDELWSPSVPSGGGTFTSAGNNCPASGASLTIPVTTFTGVGAGVTVSLTATLMKDAIFTVTVTDSKGCFVSSYPQVHSEDDRCFAGNSGNAKVKLCHKTGIAGDPCHELCVDESAVAAHLAHGDFLGSCTTDCKAPPVFAGRPIQQQIQVVNEEGYLTLKAMPNPSATDFTLLIKSPKQHKIKMRVIDLLGRVIEVKEDISANGTIKLGSKYYPGTYVVEIIQGNEKRVVKLFKLNR